MALGMWNWCKNLNMDHMTFGCDFDGMNLLTGWLRATASSGLPNLNRICGHIYDK